MERLTGTTPAPAVAPRGSTGLRWSPLPNIHEAFNVWSVPDPEAVARVIEASGADLVGLQEVARGWNINGGPDLVAWPRWRFPQYRVIFTPLLGDMVGVVILSREPVSATGSIRYAQRKSRLSYGLQRATIPTAAGDLLLINTHFSPYPGFEQDRAAQANELLSSGTDGTAQSSWGTSTPAPKRRQSNCSWRRG